MATPPSHFPLASLIWPALRGRTQMAFSSSSEGMAGSLAWEPGALASDLGSAVTLGRCLPLSGP